MPGFRLHRKDPAALGAGQEAQIRMSTHHGSLPGRPGSFPFDTQRPLPPAWHLAGSWEKDPTALGSCCLQVSRMARSSLVLAHF